MNPKMLFEILALLLSSAVGVHPALIEHTFNVFYISGWPDGVLKTQILGINGKFPGPTIEATAGDTLRVTLVNMIQDEQNTTLHWHGIHQNGTPFEDGTSQISQCPLRFGHKQVYGFQLTQPGTYWYHSHEHSQYTEGFWGSLIVRHPAGSEPYTYDDEILITLNDWYHRPAHENEAWHLSPASHGIPPYPDSGMINGRGRFNCTVAADLRRTCARDEQKRHVFHVAAGRRYRFRVINVSSYTQFRFSIDHHLLRAIEVDGVDTARAVSADVAVIAPAQRYSFLVDMNVAAAPGGKFLIRADMVTEHLVLGAPGENINPYPELVLPNVTAVLQYEFESVGNEPDTEPHDYTAVVPRSPLLNPVYLDQDKLQPLDRVLAPPLPGNDSQFTVTVTFQEDEFGVRRGSFNATPFRLPSGRPLLASLALGEELPPSAFPLHVHYGSVVQIVINNHLFHGPHPFHLHGHHFWVMGTGREGEGNYNPHRHRLIRHGAKRDTVVVPDQSWVVIRFLADNPGLWTLHCHIDWHNLTGMALTIIEAPELMFGGKGAGNNVTIPDEAVKVCAAHGIHL